MEQHSFGEFDFVEADNKVRRFNNHQIWEKRNVTPKPILLTDELCKDLFVKSEIPLPVNDNGAVILDCEYHTTDENRRFGDNVNFTGENLFEFALLNKGYLDEFNLKYVHEFQHHLSECNIWYDIREKK